MMMFALFVVLFYLPELLFCRLMFVGLCVCVSLVESGANGSGSGSGSPVNCRLSPVYGCF